jgi:phosphonate transport system ATP-binding protein
MIILADEPIASLDPTSAHRIMEILQTLNRESGITVVVSLHQVEYAKKYCSRAVALNRGKISYDGPTSGLSLQLMQDIYGGDLEDFQDNAPSVEDVPQNQAYRRLEARPWGVDSASSLS